MKRLQSIAVLFCLFLLFVSCVSSPSSGGRRSAISGMTQEQLDRELEKQISNLNNNRNIRRITLLLEAGANPNQIGVTRWINGLIYSDEFEIVKLLFDYGVDPNFREIIDRNRRGRTLAHSLSISAGSGSTYRKADGIMKRFEFMASCGVRFDIIDNNGDSPLMKRARDTWFDTELFNFILDWEEDNNPTFSANFKNRNDYLTEVLRRYISSSSYGGIDTNFIERLIIAGANPSARGENGVLIIFENRSFDSRRHIVNYLPLFIEHGIPLNETDRDGYTLLHYAVKQDTEGDVIKLLLDRGANPNAKSRDRYGYTPLMLATSLKIAELLISHGADPLIKSANGNTALHQWIENNGRPRDNNQLESDMLQRIELLLEHGCSINDVNYNGQTPLMLAMRRLNDNQIYRLLEYGADANQKDYDGSNVLFYFADRAYNVWWINVRDHRRMAQTLLDKGVNPAEINVNGDSALSYLFKVSGESRGRELRSIRKIFAECATEKEMEIAREAIPRRTGSNISFTRQVLPFLILPVASIASYAAYTGNREDNFMGAVNSILTYTAIGGVIGFIPSVILGLRHTFQGDGGSFGFWFGVSLASGMIYGINRTFADDSVRREFSTNPILYFIPSGISLFMITIDF